MCRESELAANGGGQILWLWTFMNTLDDKCCPAPESAEKEAEAAAGHR